MIAHAGYIAFAYGIAVVVIAGMIVAVTLEHRRLKRELAAYEDRDA